MTISAGQQATGAARTAPEADRVERAFASARRHSHRVRKLKFVLPVGAALLVAVFAGWTWLGALPGGGAINIAAIGLEDGRLVMADPKLEGFTGDDRPYTMTAMRAIQDLGGGGRIDLEKIDARLPFDDEGWMTVVAEAGVYDSDAGTLDLDTDIKVVTSRGVTALLRSAAVDMAAGSMSTQDPVDITMDGTRIEADSMVVQDNGAVMIFERRVRVEIDANRMRAASAAEGEKNGN